MQASGAVCCLLCPITPCQIIWPIEIARVGLVKPQGYWGVSVQAWESKAIVGTSVVVDLVVLFLLELIHWFDYLGCPLETTLAISLVPHCLALGTPRQVTMAAMQHIKEQHSTHLWLSSPSLTKKDFKVALLYTTFRIEKNKTTSIFYLSFYNS